MPLVKLFSAFVILMAQALFIFMNTRGFDGGTGYVFLLLALAAFGVLVLASGDLANVFLVRKSAVILFFFLFYFFVKFYFESGNGQETRELIVGTTGGVLFALVMGLLASSSLAVIYDLRQVRAVSGLIYLLALIYVLVSLALVAIVFQGHFADVRTDKLLISENTGKYQRIGDLLIMLVMTVVALGCVLIASASRNSLIRSVPASVLILFLAALAGFTAQIVGSNKGIVVPVVLALIYLMVMMVAVMNLGDKRRIGIAHMIFGSLGVKLILASIIAGGLLFAFADTLIAYFNIDVSGLRITGFGSDDRSSIDSREEIFKQNFMTHFTYSPFFGNTQVDKLTTGAGTYVHSVLSVFTHLGLFGGLMFTAFIISVYHDITRKKRSSENSLYANSRYGIFRLLAFMAMLIMCGFSAFFTWMPLWFAFGLVGDWFHSRRVESSHGHRRRRSKRRVRIGSSTQNLA